MSFNDLLPALIVLSALIPGVLIFCTAEQNVWLRRTLNFAGNVSCLALIGLLISGVYAGDVFEMRLPLLPDIDLVLHADALSLLFVSLSGLLWLLTTIYALGYLEGTQNHSRFFGFFSLCVAATLGIALAGNLITFLIFYELLTLTTYPLVVHKGNAASLRAGRIYLAYTMAGGALLLAGVVWLKALAGPLDFTATGILSAMPELDPGHLKIIFALIIAGLGVKAALVPLYGWLPVAMAAPAPVSALLHAVAVVKAGAFGIVRVVYDVYGIEFARDLGLTDLLGVIAAFTIVYGSVLALRQDDLKKRLAYSTVSQVSYIALGTAIAGPIATIGGMVHLVHQGVMKITLFFCAGNLAETLGIHKVSELNGVGRRMPLTMAAFTVAALGMIGLPPVAGFVSKWYLGTGALEVEAHWVLVILAISSVLNALYFLPLLHAAWFKPAAQTWAPKQSFWETSLMLLLPPVVTALLALIVGVFAGMSISPLSWVELIAAREYGQELMRDTEAGGLFSPQMSWVILTPLLLASGLLIPALRQLCVRLAPWAALPALLAGLMLPAGPTMLPDVFFGSVLVIDQNSRLMLLLAAILWLIVGVYGVSSLKADKNLVRYTLYFLLCMSGSFGLTLSQDLFGFITFFALMSFAAYGLVVHSGSPEAMLAGKTYMQWVVIGEVLLFAALVGLAISGGGEALMDLDRSQQPLWVSWLLLFGFGIKAGLLTTHFWLPRAHPVAPVPASALLSGLMVKAGLIGWWRFLPLGEVVLIEVGVALLVLGFGGAFLAVIIGLVQHNPKRLLAYSTISQMGILAAGVGAGLLVPELWPILSVALLIYAVHHGLAKGALFLSVGFIQLLSPGSAVRWLAWLTVLVPALAMAGLPFTSGALAKSALKSSLAELVWMVQLLPMTAIGTTLLMLRFVDLLHKASCDSKPANIEVVPHYFACGVLVLFVVSMLYLVPQAKPFMTYALSAQALASAFWPVLAGTLIYLLIRTYLTNMTPLSTSNSLVEGGALPSWFGDVNKKYIAHISRYPGNVANVPDKLAFPVLPNLQVHPGVTFIGILVCLGIILVYSAPV